MKSKMFWLIFAFAYVQKTEFVLKAAASSAAQNAFAVQLFDAIALENCNENIIISPFAIQSCLTLGFFGANGQTAKEMRYALGLNTQHSSGVIAHDFSNFLNKAIESGAASGAQLIMINRIFVNDILRVRAEFNKTARQSFKTKVEPIDFTHNQNAAFRINQWISESSAQTFRQLLSAQSINYNINALLLSAAYFEGLWLHPFNEALTRKATFQTITQAHVFVDMMHMIADIKYANWHSIAKLIELPYKDSTFSMLIILPDTIAAFQQLQLELCTMDLNEITQEMHIEKVDVLLPKFRIEFTINLRDALYKLGMRSMLSKNADFSNLFKTKLAESRYEAGHKAYIDVNETGSAAATNCQSFKQTSNNFYTNKKFRATRPFIFFIRDNHGIYVAGQVLQF